MPPHLRVYEQGKYQEADTFSTRAISVAEKKLGMVHPSVAGWLNNRARILTDQVGWVCVCRMLPLAIFVSDAIKTLSVCTSASCGQGRYKEADPLFLRAISIGKRTLGSEHPTLAGWYGNRAELLAKEVRAIFCG